MNATPWPSVDRSSAANASARTPWSIVSKRSTGTRWLALIAGAILLLPAPRATAQKLNLDKTDAPTPASAKAGPALADELDKEAEVFSRPRGAGQAPPAARARAALRKLAAEWIRAGGQDPDNAAPRALVGRTIALRRAALDAAIGPDDAAPARAFTAAALAHDLEHHAELSTDAAIDRFLRDTLWPLIDAPDLPAGTGWVIAGAPPAPSRPLHELAALTDLETADLLVVSSAEKAMDEAGAVPVYRPSTESLRRAAAIVLETLAHGRARLLAPAVRELIRRELLESLNALAAPAPEAPAALAAGEHLRRLALLCDALVKAASFDAGNNQARVVRTALEELATSRKWREDPGLPQRLRVLSRTLDNAAPDIVATDDRLLARQFRPALRALEPLIHQSAQQTLEVAPRLLTPEGAADPAALGAINAHARRLTDVRLLLAAAATISTGKPGDAEVPAQRKFLGERFLTLGQDVGRADKRDLAITELRDLSVQVRDITLLPAEKELRSSNGDPGWRDATAGKARDLVTALDSARNSWNTSWTGPRSLPPAAATRRLTALRDNLPLLADAAAALALSRDSRIQSWPGFELSERACAWLKTGLAESAQPLSAALASGTDEAIAAARKKLTTDFMSATTIGRLDRRARAIGVVTLADPAADAIAQLSLGPPADDAWLASARPEVASLCRLIEEAAALDPKSPDLARYRAAADRAARAIATRLDAEPPEDR